MLREGTSRHAVPRHSDRLRIFTWHVHGTYLYYLSQANCDFYLPVRADRSDGYGGVSGSYPLADNIHEIAVEDVKDAAFDIILFQSRRHYEIDQYEIFSPAQLKLPKVYLEHDPPREHPTDTQHIAASRDTMIVHCTHFNRLMWNNGPARTAVIEHGVIAPEARYSGTLDRGIVVINNLHSRGRRLGYDVFEYARDRVPVDLVGLNAADAGGIGPIDHRDLPEFVSQYRFFFNPIRYTSMGLAIIEAMMVGLPVVGLATTELVSVIRSGWNGFISLDPDELVDAMKRLLDDPDLARTWGENARAYALERFSIERFARDWELLFWSVYCVVT